MKSLNSIHCLFPHFSVYAFIACMLGTWLAISATAGYGSDCVSVDSGGSFGFINYISPNVVDIVIGVFRRLDKGFLNGPCCGIVHFQHMEEVTTALSFKNAKSNGLMLNLNMGPQIKGQYWEEHSKTKSFFHLTSRLA